MPVLTQTIGKTGNNGLGTVNGEGRLARGTGAGAGTNDTDTDRRALFQDADAAKDDSLAQEGVQQVTRVRVTRGE
jgi:hypothetical protein